ncbi:DUF554 domain-containing protein [Streptococcus pluranimalium]|uniref:DUF554 domain-containing protein n=1 Tax=Streptococcus pluranimalium TaxID=82348 RepID=UPI0039EB75E8
MFGLGTLINTGAIIAAGIVGSLFGHHLKQRHQETVMVAAGISVMFIGISGAMEGMLSLSDGKLSSGQAMLLVLSMTIGGLIGEWLGIEDGFERLGYWLQEKSGNANDNQFVSAFVTASLTVCIGAMGIVGAIQDGILRDPSILMTKAILDFTIILVTASSLGKGAGFSAIPVLCFQGFITLLAQSIKPMMTEVALANISLVGSVLIFCVGLNLVFGQKVRLANLLPALLIAVLIAYI